MKELVGKCQSCNKEIYCLDGFFNGVITEEKENYCFYCYARLMNEKEDPQN